MRLSLNTAHVCLALTGMAPATASAGERACTVILDAASNAVLLREGDCASRLSPASSFKVALALIGYDSGILKDSNMPALKFQPTPETPKSDNKTVDPRIWLQDSVVWYSQALTRQLGEPRFAEYVQKLSYGNADVSGIPGRSIGLTQAWLDSSLKISPDEQAAFMRRIVDCTVAVSSTACALTKKIMPVFKADTWTVYGKTGTVLYRKDPQGKRTGWFVGWAEQDGRKIVFASVHDHAGNELLPAGPQVRDDFLKRLRGFRP